MALTPHLLRSLRSFLGVLAACLVAALVAPGSASAQAPARKALINGATVMGSPGFPSLEEQAATAQGYAVTVVTQAVWGAMTQAEFGAYDLLIIGDLCGSNAPQDAAANAATWAPVVMGTAGGRTQAGNRIVIGTDPALHNIGGLAGERAAIIRDGIAFAGKQTGRTGLYFCASCAGGGGNVLTALGLLSTGSGAWTDNSEPPCGGNVSLIASEPSFATLTTASLADWGCSVHESWPTFATDWNALAVATDTLTTPTCGIDPNTTLSACGQAYILIAGSSIVVFSDSIAVTPADATNPAGTNHTVTAHVTNDDTPVVGQVVTFTVTGQNAGAAGTCLPAGCVTNADGDVSFTYLGANGAGDDTIKASFTDNAGSLQAATAQKHWEGTESPFMAFGDWAEDVEIDVDFTPQETEVRTAYLALQEEGVKILDVSDPGAITTLGSFDPGTCKNGSSTVSFFADDVEFVEELDALFVAVGRCGVLALNVADPAHPVVLGYYNTPVWAEAVEVEFYGEAPIGFIADHNGGLRIVDFANFFDGSPSTPVLRGAIGSSTTGWGTGAAIDVAFLDNDHDLLLFVAASQGLRVVNVNSPASPQLIGGYNTSPNGTPPEVPQDITLSDDGNIAYLAGWQAGLLAIDVSDPTEPTLADQVSTTPGLAYYESEVVGNLVYATEGKGGLRKFVRGDGPLDPSGAEPIPIAGGNGWAWDVQVVDGVAYVTFGILEDGTGGLAVIELPSSDFGIDLSSEPTPDGDGDGRPDSEDNCLDVANPGQADVNLDGFGDACDADYDDDGAVNAMDFATLAAAYLSQAGGPRWNPAVDHDGNGTINAIDFGVFGARYLTTAGPSGLSCAGVVPCPSL